MQSITAKLIAISGKQKIQQTGALYFVAVANILIGVATSSLSTKILGANGFGSYSLIINIFNVAQVVFLFGFFHSGARLLISASDRKTIREYYGVSLVISLVLYALMGAALSGFVLVDNNLNAKGLSDILLCCVPAGIIFILMSYFEILLPASNEIGLLARSRFLPRLYFLIAILAVFVFLKNNKYVFQLVMFVYFLSYALTYYDVLQKISPSFSRLTLHMKEISEINKVFGLQVYVGTIFTTATTALTGIVISYYSIDNVGVGHFALATSLCAPLALIPNILGTVYFRDFSTQDSISRQILIGTLIITGAAATFVCLAAGKIVIYLFGTGYLPVVKIIYPLSLGFMFYGIADLINRFLWAHGQGGALRNCSFVVGAALFCGNVFFINKFGVLGAAIAKVVAGTIYVICMGYYYISYRKDKTVYES